MTSEGGRDASSTEQGRFGVLAAGHLPGGGGMDTTARSCGVKSGRASARDLHVRVEVAAGAISRPGRLYQTGCQLPAQRRSRGAGGAASLLGRGAEEAQWDSAYATLESRAGK